MYLLFQYSQHCAGLWKLSLLTKLTVMKILLNYAILIPAHFPVYLRLITYLTFNMTWKFCIEEVPSIARYPKLKRAVKFRAQQLLQ
jgi:hypothetical protein